MASLVYEREIGVDDLWLSSAYFKILANFRANEYWLNSCLHLYTEILWVSVRAAYQRFLIVRQSLQTELTGNYA